MTQYVQAGKTVCLQYTLSLADGTPIDSSSESGTWTYVHGHTRMPAGLVKGVEGLAAGNHVRLTLPPAITIASGEELVVERWDAYKGVWGADQEPPEVGAATGPIAVEGAGPGDALRIDILAITPGPAAMHDVRPGRGFLGETFTERH